MKLEQQRKQLNVAIEEEELASESSYKPILCGPCELCEHPVLYVDPLLRNNLTHSSLKFSLDCEGIHREQLDADRRRKLSGKSESKKSKKSKDKGKKKSKGVCYFYNGTKIYSFHLLHKILLSFLHV